MYDPYGKLTVLNGQADAALFCDTRPVRGRVGTLSESVPN